MHRSIETDARIQRPLDLRLIVITDAQLAAPRSVRHVVRECLEAGAPAVQLRDKMATARELFDEARALRELTREFGALLFINDRYDVALAADADGVHVGPHDVPLASLRAAAPADFLIGGSTDDPHTARAFEDSGASYVGCGAVFGTRTKTDLGDERIGTAGLERVVQATALPVVAIGGITPENAAQAVAAGASGLAVVSALMRAEAPGAVVRSFLDAFARTPRQSSP